MGCETVKLIMGYCESFFMLFWLLSICQTSITEKVCEGNVWVNSGNIHSFKDCTKIKGSLRISKETFTGYDGLPEMEPDELEVFSTLLEVKSLRLIRASHPNFTDLHYFRNLETVGGPDDFGGLRISHTSLKSLGLRSLRTISHVIVSNNDKLCFVEGIKWQKFMKFGFSAEVENNSPVSKCVAEDMVCHKWCSMDGCWGPSVDECLSCSLLSLDETCLDSCSYLGMYQLDNQTCGKCHESCNETCDEQETSICKKCFKDGPYCVAKCPAMKYEINNECLPCNEKCAIGCTGPADFLGSGGCDTCDKSIIDSDNLNQIIRCIKANEMCLEGYFSDLVSVTESAQGLISIAGKSVCRTCHPKCKKCKGYGLHVSVCDVCVNFRSNEQCEDQCPTDYYTDNSTKSCLRCFPECKGCWGPGPDQCKSCKNLKVPIGDNITYEFNCSDSCPEDKPLRIYKDQDGPYCSNKRPVEDKNINVPAIIGGVLGCTFLIFVAVVVYQWRQRAKSREKSMMKMLMSELEDSEPLRPSDVKPNMAQLRIVKETELRKGSVLGFGAFGTVYKAVWVPEGENVKIPVAIKILRNETGTNANKEMLEEAYLMASIAHQYLLKLLAVCMASQMMLVTQLMPLGCLLDYVRTNQVNIGSKALLNWCTQIAKGMAHLEEKRLVHRDLAARNVLVHTPGCIKITDFGLAKLLDVEDDAYNATEGKVAIKWLAPECIRLRRFTHKSDAWAFGVTIWELMTYGGRPYEQTPAREVPALLERGERLTQPDICTIEVYMIMVKCWIVDAESRPSFKELVKEFTKMARDPGRYLVIEGDSLMRLPTYTPQDEKDLIRRLSVTIEGTEVIMDAEDYLRPKTPDGAQDKSSHSYLEVVDNPLSLADTDKNGKTIEGRIDVDGYLIPLPPQYDYAYSDLPGPSSQGTNATTSTDGIEQTMQYNKP